MFINSICFCPSAFIDIDDTKLLESQHRQPSTYNNDIFYASITTRCAKSTAVFLAVFNGCQLTHTIGCVQWGIFNVTLPITTDERLILLTGIKEDTIKKRRGF